MIKNYSKYISIKYAREILESDKLPTEREEIIKEHLTDLYNEFTFVYNAIKEEFSAMPLEEVNLKFSQLVANMDSMDLNELNKHMIKTVQQSEICREKAEFGIKDNKELYEKTNKLLDHLQKGLLKQLEYIEHPFTTYVTNA